MALELADSMTVDAKEAAPPSTGDDRRAPRGQARWRREFTEQLLLLLDAKMALVPALESIVDHSPDKGMKLLVESMRDSIAEGSSFADTLARHPGTFSSTYVILVRAAEAGGYVPKVLRHLLAIDERDQALRSTLGAAFSYPIFLIAFSGAVILFVLAFVFPKFTDMFAGMGGDLPATTVALMATSDFLLTHYAWLAPAAGGFVVVCVWWLSSPAGASWLHDMSDRIPLVNGIMTRVYLIHTLRSLHMSLENGVTFVEALDAAADAAPNTRFRRTLHVVLDSVNAGEGAAKAFREARFLPQLARDLLATGEEAGDMGLVSGRLATHYETELERLLVKLSKIIEPALLLVMGAVVGVIVASLILPIFKLANAVH